MRIATGFMASKFLFVAVELRLFEHLVRGTLDLPALAAAAQAPTRTVRIVADALVSIGLLTKDSRGYANSAAAQAVLSGAGTADLRATMRHFDRIGYADWAGLEDAVRTGEATRRKLDRDDERLLAEGIEALSAPLAAAISAVHDFGGHRRLLDIGGGAGHLLCAILQRYPNLQATLVDRDEAASLARVRIEQAGLAHRAAVLAQDIFEADLPAGHDATLIANVLHLMSPERNRRLLQRVRDRADRGDRLLLVDLFTDETRTAPRFAALMAGTFLTGYGEGDVYSVTDVLTWARETEWDVEHVHDLGGSSKLVVAARR